MFELTEDFIKMLQIAFLVVGTLSIFLIFISYDVNVFRDEARREALLFLEGLLTDRCLAVVENNKSIKALFSGDKLDNLEEDCIVYENATIQIELLDGTRAWSIDFGPAVPQKDIKTEEFNVAIDMGAEGIKPGTIVVSI